MKAYLIVSVAVNIALVASDMASNQTSNLCLTPGCIHAASRVLNNMDASVEPCDDFYQFACGNFIKQTIIPDNEDEASYMEFTKDLVKQQVRVILEENVTTEEPHLFNTLKKVYQACMNTTAIELDGLTTIRSILQELGGWPVLKGPKWDQKKFDWKQSVYKFRNLGYDSDYFMSVKLAAVTNSSQNGLLILEAGVSLSNSSDLESYLNKMVHVATALGAKKRVAKRELHKSLKLELKLSMMANLIREQTKFSSRLELTSIPELQQKVPNIPWLEYLNSVLNVPNITIKTSDVILSPDIGYLSKLEKLLINTPKRVQANYLIWKAVESSIPYLTEKLQQDKYSTFRWKKCVGLILKSMPTAAGVLYARKHFHEDVKQDVMEMVSDIRKEFANMVKRADWIDDDTKQHALEKAAAMPSYVAYPDELLSDEKLEDLYKGLHVESDNFLKIGLSTKLFDYENAAKRLVQTDWDEYQYVTNVDAYNQVNTNKIFFPAAILQGVYFSDDRPWYMNYGGIGFVIAHEIIHGFDSDGRLRDKFGHLKDWWAPSTNATFITKAQCIINQYGNHSVPEVGLNLNGFKTQGENIADNGGIRTAYLAYNEWVRRNGRERLLPGLNYTDRQLFWISTANVWCEKLKPIAAKRKIHTDEHPPAKFRINVPLSNTDYFAKDFNCRIGSKMNPVKKCEVWK